MAKKVHSPILLKFLTLGVLRRRPRQLLPSKTKCVFVVSSGRTGTKFLAEYFKDSQSTCALHEPKPSRILRMWSIAFLSKKAEKKDLERVLYAKRRRLLKNVKAKYYIESNPYLAGFSGVIPNVFDSPIIIHVVRDPRDYVRSAMNHGNSFGIKLLLNKYFYYWYPPVERLLGLKKTLPMHQKAAAYWQLVNEFINEECKQYDNYHVIKYEDIFNEQKTGLKKIEDLIGLHSDRRETSPVNKSAHNVHKAWNQWTKDECKAIDKLCQPTMAKFGYGTERQWQEKLS